MCESSIQYLTKKIETHRTRLTAKGNLIDYSGEVSTPTSDLTAMKLHIKSAISDVKSVYMCMEVNIFYLNTQMDMYEYITIQLSIIPQEFVEKYYITDKCTHGTTS